MVRMLSHLQNYFLEKQQLIEGSRTGKKVNFIGDSITSGTAKGKFVSYVSTVNRILKLSEARNYGISGGTIVSRNQGMDAKLRPVVTRWQDMHTDVDVIFMLIGTNDYATQVPIGSIDSTSTTDFNGSFNLVLSGLKESFPDTAIVVSTLLNRMAKPMATHPIPISVYNDAIIDRCRDHAITCYNLHEVPDLDLETDYSQGLFRLTNDGLHPNKEGSMVLGRYIAEIINSILKS
jgi:lysophospholipase L1-like esterase